MHPIALRAHAMRLVAVILIVLLLPIPQLNAQAAQVAGPAMLHITILEGEDALNNIRERTAREPIIQVEDENHKPVAGVAIVFAARSGGNGASASFNGANSFTTVTDAQGRAVGRGFHPNSKTGRYTVEVTATVMMMTVLALIHETNKKGSGVSAKNKLLHPNKYVVTAVVAGVAAGIAIGLTRGSNGAIIQPGTGTVVAPGAIPITGR